MDVLALSGEFDQSSAHKFDEEVDALIGDYRTRIVVDLSQLRFMDSAGLTRLLHTQRRLRPLGGEQVVAAPPGVVKTAIKTAGIDQTVRVFPDVDEACKYFSHPERARQSDLDGVEMDEAHIGRTEVEFGIAGEEGSSATGKLLTVYADGVMLGYPIDPARSGIEEQALDVGRTLWIRFRQPALAPDREFSMEARVQLSLGDGDATKYRLVFTEIDEADRTWMREVAESQDAIRKYGKPPG